MKTIDSKTAAETIKDAVTQINNTYNGGAYAESKQFALVGVRAVALLMADNFDGTGFNRSAFLTDAGFPITSDNE